MTESGIKNLIVTVLIFSKDIGMKFGAKGCGMFIITKHKAESSDGVRLRNCEKIKDAETNEYE